MGNSVDTRAEGLGEGVVVLVELRGEGPGGGLGRPVDIRGEGLGEGVVVLVELRGGRPGGGLGILLDAPEVLC